MWHRTLELKAKCQFLQPSRTFQLAPTQCKWKGNYLSWMQKSDKLGGRLQVWELLQKIKEGVTELGKKVVQKTQISGVQKEEQGYCEKHIQRRNMGKNEFISEIIRKCKLKEVEKRVEFIQVLHDAVIYSMRHLSEISDICKRLQVNK